LRERIERTKKDEWKGTKKTQHTLWNMFGEMIEN
jgi:hypothetical protein